VEARSRLGTAAPPPAKPKRARPASPFSEHRRLLEIAEAFPRHRRLFTAPIIEIDDEGNPVSDDAPLVPIAHWRTIAREVAEKHHVLLSDMVSPRRARHIVDARYEAFWRCRNETAMSLPQIGKRFGGRDHTTVLHGVREYERRIAEQEPVEKSALIATGADHKEHIEDRHSTAPEAVQ